MILSFLQRRPFLLPIGIALSSIIMIHSSIFQNNPKVLSWAIAGDLLLTSPLLYYLLIRKSKTPRITILSVGIVGLLILNFIMPESQLSSWKKMTTSVLPILELVLFGWVIFQILRARRALKNKGHLAILKAIRLKSQELFPKRVANLLATEIACLYYNLLCWRKPMPGTNEFTYHKKSGVNLIIGTLIGVMLVETFAVHLLLNSWSTTAAWIATGLSLYSVFQFTALLKSLPYEPARIDHQEKLLYLPYGFFMNTKIRISELERIEVTARSLPQHREVTTLAPLGGLIGHNLILHLTNHAHLQGIYGTNKTFISLSIWIDEREQFLSELESLGVVIIRK